MIDALIQLFQYSAVLINLSSVKTHFGHTEIGFTSFGFAQNTLHDFQNTVLNSVALSSTEGEYGPSF